MSPARVLVVDDDDNIREGLAQLLEREGYRVDRAADAEEGLARVGEEDYDLVFLDYALPGLDGLEALPRFKARAPEVPVIMITGFGSSELAVRALQFGAVDFVDKPFNVARVRASAQHALEQRRLSRRVSELEERLFPSFEGIVTRSPKMHRIFTMIDRVRHLTETILLLGESGTGKELLARAIHRTSSRAKGPFVTINCAAIPAELLESELFGYEKGAFTGADRRHVGKVEQANGGTLFLDEIGDLSLSLQAKVLRVLQERAVTPLGSSEERRVDVRFVAATHRDLEAMVAEGSFREDLYYRLARFPIEIPPLRERPEDVVPLVEHFLAEARAEGIDVAGIAPAAVEVLERYTWPGNIRELENVVRRAAILAAGGTIELEHLPSRLLLAADVQLERPEPALEPQAAPALIPEWSSPEEVLPFEEVEKRVIRAAMAACGGNVTETARRLGIGRATLYRKLEQYKLQS